MKLLWFIVLSFFALTSCTQKSTSVNAVQGIAAVDSSVLQHNNTVELNGEWEFYWNQLLSPTDFTNLEPSPNHANLPGIWLGTQYEQQELPGVGFATYRLLVNNSTVYRTLSLSSTEFYTSYKVWVNNQLIAQSGKPSTSAAQTEPCMKPLAASFQLPDSIKQFYITIQVTNYHHAKGGIWDSIVLSTAESLSQQQINRSRVMFFLVGFIFIMSIYFLVVYLLMPSNGAELYFTLFTFVMVLRLFFTDQRLIYEVWPTIPFEVVYKFDYISAYFNIVLMALFFLAIFPNEFNKRAKQYLRISGIAGVSFVLLTPTSFYTQFVTLFMVYALSMGVYIALWVLPRAVIRKREGAKEAFIGLSLFFATGIIDLLMAAGYIRTPYLMPFGLSCFIFCQGVVLAVRFTGFFKQNLKLTEELNYKNQNLEKIVVERTAEISEQNEELNQQNEEIQAQRDELEAQGDALAENVNQLHKNAEMVKSSISYATTIQNAILPPAKAFDQFSDYNLIYLPKDIVSGDFYWASQPLEHINSKYFAVVDCTGHGVPGAFVSIIGSRLLNEITHQNKAIEPSNILQQMDIGMKKTLQQEVSSNNDGMDVTLIRLDELPNGGYTATFAGAKQSLLVWNNITQQLKRITGTRKSIGGRAKTRPFDQHTITLQKDDILYLYSDGIIDQGNPSGKRFGTTYFTNLIQTNINEPIATQKEVLHNALISFQADAPRRDDITVLILKI